MKKTGAIFTIILSVSFFTTAQINPHAIGLRFSGNENNKGIEISYQHKLGKTNRTEFDFGFSGYKNYNNIFLSGLYHWVWNLTNSLNWYVGPGVALGFYKWDDGMTSNNGLNLGLGGQIGLEFDFTKFETPLLLSIDARPMFDFIGYNKGLGWGATLGVRYIW